MNDHRDSWGAPADGWPTFDADGKRVREYRTKTGRVLTDADFEALADEAERGYDVSHLVKKVCYDCDGEGCPYCGGPEQDYHTACIPCQTCQP